MFLKTPFNIRVSKFLEEIRNNKCGWSMANQDLVVTYRKENKDIVLQIINNFYDILIIKKFEAQDETQNLLQAHLLLKERYTCLFP